MTEQVISRIKDLKYLGRIKNFNISAVTKNKEFNDVVKFYAQITSDNKIEKISFQVSGCTKFMAVCSYFCEMIEGMKVASALKLTVDDIKKVIDVNSVNDHEYIVVIETFALLIKKYNKGVSKGIVQPVEVEKTSKPDNETNETSAKETKVSTKEKTKKATKKEDKKEKRSKKTKEKKSSAKEIQKEHLSSLQEKIKQKESHDKEKEETKQEKPKKKSLFSRFKKK